MIVLVAARFHTSTLASIEQGLFGVPTPSLRMVHYERLFRAWRIPRATYIFVDMERLAPWELKHASLLYRAIRAAGLRCLNDPARVKARAELLSALHRSGFNPFAAYRADDAPEPVRYPVFIRGEHAHETMDTTLYHDHGQLNQALASLEQRGIPLRGQLVIEQAAEPYSRGLWAKWGTWKIADQVITEHISVDDTWMVKTGDRTKVTDAVVADEHQAVMSNRYAAAIAPAFESANMDYGRADHAVYRSRSVVYEINTNPYIGQYVPDKRPLRRETQLYGRAKLAEAFAAIDTPSGGRVTLDMADQRRPLRWWRLGFSTPRYP